MPRRFFDIKLEHGKVVGGSETAASKPRGTTKIKQK
jgi:hypothetical protein